MPYKLPEWAKIAQTKFNSLLPTLGNLDKSALDLSESPGVENIPLPGTIRRDAPDLANVITTPLPATTGKGFGSASQIASQKYKNATQTVRDDSFKVSFGKPGAVGTLIDVGEVTLKQVGKFLEKGDITSVAGLIKSTAVETAAAVKRQIGVIGISGYLTLQEPLFRKYLKERVGLGDMTAQERAQYDATIAPAVTQLVKDLGYNIDDLGNNKEIAMQVAKDTFTIASTATAVYGTAKAIPGALKAGEVAASELSGKFATEIINDAVKAGKPLIIDTAGNVFANPTTAKGVKVFVKTVLAANRPVFTELYKGGLALEAVQYIRKYIDPDTAERIARDQRKFIDSFSPAERFAIDLGIGLWLPFEVPGLKTTKNFLSKAESQAERTFGSYAFDKFFSDDESLKVLDKLAEIKDLGTGISADQQAKANLIKHTLTTLGENKRSALNFEHFVEEWNRFANKIDDPEIKAFIQRAKTEGTNTHLSWFSEKLNRSLTPAESLMHWFVTESEGKYIGDLGEELVARFQKAIELRTTGLPEVEETVLRTITRIEKVKELTGQVVKAGDAGEIRQLIDAAQSEKTEMLSQLSKRVESLGFQMIRQDGKLIVPTQALEDTNVRMLLDNLKGLSDEINRVVGEGRALGIPGDILRINTNEELLRYMEAYEKFTGAQVKAQTNMFTRNLLSNSTDKDIGLIKAYLARNPEARDRILTGKVEGLYQKFQGMLDDFRGTVLPENATDDEVLDFVLSFPTSADTKLNLPKNVLKTITEQEKGILKINEAISNFDNQLVSYLRATPNPQLTEVKEVVEQVRKIEAQLPRGAFAPEFLAEQTRWGAGVTEVPLANLDELTYPKWAEALVKLQDANGVTRWLTDYLVPHNPADIYVKAINRLNSTLETQAPGKVEAIIREISQVQDRGISLIPAMPGGGPTWRALGKPMISGVDWKTLDAIGNKYGVEKLGNLTREVFVNSLTETGIKPGIVDRLRASPSVGGLFDALYRQYMLTRFALNPIFHVQQMPETALIGAMRSFNLPTEMSQKYLKTVFKLPTQSLDDGEKGLFKLLKGDLFAKVAKTGEATDLGAITQEGLELTDVLESTTLEETKRLRAFIAEFPVQLRGTLFDMPALKNTDPLMLDEYRDIILGIQGDARKITELIGTAHSTSGFDVLNEAVRRAVKETNVEVQKLTSYNLNRSGLEKDLHAILFPFSFSKKAWSEIAGFATGGSVARLSATGEAITQFSDYQDSPTMMEIRAKYPTMVGWIYNMAFVNPQFPIVNTSEGSVGFGGAKGTPFQAILWDTFVNPDGKYNIGENPAQALRKLGGGGAAFFLRDLPAAYSEVFKNDTAEEQRRRTYMLQRLQLEHKVKELTGQ